MKRKYIVYLKMIRIIHTSIKNLYNGESNLVKYVSDLTHDLLFNNTFQSKVLKNLQTIVNENIPLRINENEILLIEFADKEILQFYKTQVKYISNKVFEEMVPSDILKPLNINY